MIDSTAGLATLRKPALFQDAPNRANSGHRDRELVALTGRETMSGCAWSMSVSSIPVTIGSQE